MAYPVNIPGDLVIPGNLRVAGTVSPAIAKSAILAQADLQPFNVPWTAWRVFDAMGTPLPSAAANDDLGLVCGTHGTAHPTIQAGDVDGLSSTRYARAVLQLPWDYVAGQDVTLRFYAACLGLAATTTCTLDISVYLADGDTTLHADGDLAPAAVANNMKSIVFANADFALTPTTNLSPGSELDVLLSIAYVDDGTGGAKTPCIGLVQMLCDVR